MLESDQHRRDCSHTDMFGRRVQLDFAVEESDKLSGKFNVYADLNLEAARALAKALNDLVRQAEQLPVKKIDLGKEAAPERYPGKPLSDE